jgi:hypothetical protein
MRIPEFDAILAGLRPIPMTGRPAARPMWIAPELLEKMRRGPEPALIRLELPRPHDHLQVDDQIDPPTPPRSRRRR